MIQLHNQLLYVGPSIYLLVGAQQVPPTAPSMPGIFLKTLLLSRAGPACQSYNPPLVRLTKMSNMPLGALATEGTFPEGTYPLTHASCNLT